jgi:queuine tRNA-ribosyltransferase
VPGDAVFTIARREAGGPARAGLLHTAHGDVHTPAFVPLASTGTVRGLLPEEVAALGYEMVLGNTFHLMLLPGAELIERLGGLHRFMGWERPIITDSGGFQVFSMGHGRVADEIKSSRRRAAAGPAAAAGAAAGQATASSPQGTARGGARDGAGQASEGMLLGIDEEGARFRSYVDGRELLLSPERSMAVQAALGSDVALAFDECTPYRADRLYTARSTERTHRWLERCIAWHGEHARAHRLLYGIVQGGVFEDLRRDSARTVARSGCHGVAIGGTLGRTKEQMRTVARFALEELEGEHETLPRHLLGIGEVDDLIAGVEMGIDTFDCAMPTRLGRHGSALVTDAPQDTPAGAHASGRRWRIDVASGRWREDERPLQRGCPCPACARGLSRAYLSHLARNRELTGMRLLTTHNLAFLARLMEDLRAAIHAGRLAEVASAWRAGRGFELARPLAGSGPTSCFRPPVP